MFALLFCKQNFFVLFQIKNDIEAEVLCMTAIGNIKLQQNNMEETKVRIWFCFVSFCEVLSEFYFLYKGVAFYTPSNKLLTYLHVITLNVCYL